MKSGCDSHDKPNDTSQAFVLMVTRAEAPTRKDFESRNSRSYQDSQSHMGNMIIDHTMSTATIPKNESEDAKRAIIKRSSNKMVKPPTQAAYGNVEVEVILPWSRI